jgi:hypothetical protein
VGSEEGLMPLGANNNQEKLIGLSKRERKGERERLKKEEAASYG